MAVDKEKRYQNVINVHFPDVSSISRAIRHILLRLKSGISALRRFIVLPPKWVIWAISLIVVIVAQFTRLAVLEDKTRLAYGYSILVMKPESVEHLVFGSAFRQLNTITDLNRNILRLWTLPIRSICWISETSLSGHAHMRKHCRSWNG
jgi:hypothetical protein